MESSKSKRKKTPSSSRHKQPQHLQIIKKNMLNVYCSKPSQHKKNNQPRLKLQAQRKKKTDTSDYEFPQFAIYFREGSTNKKMGQSEATKKSVKLDRSKIDEKRKKKQCNNSVVQKKSTIKNISQVKESNIKQDDGLQRVEEVLGVSFAQALRKTFKMMDIFNRGKISEANINKWVPESLLYFLGKPLQKIRQDRLTLTENQFVQLCRAVLQDSSPEDIQQFIRQATSNSCLKASVNMTEHHEQETMSPIKKRMIEEEALRSSHKKSGILKKNHHLDNVIEMIKSRQAEVGQKIRDLKEKRKSVTFKPLQEIQSNQPLNSRNELKPHFESIGIQVSEFQNEKIKLCESIKQESLRGSTNIQKSMISQQSMKSKPSEIERPYIANFTFQLPQVPDHTTAPEIRGYQQQRGRNFILHNHQFKFQEQNQPNYSNSNRPLSARILDKRFEDHQKEDLNHTFRAVDSNQDLRIDRLRSKIDSYMRRNAEKIEKSRSFFLEMSPNHY